jgi:hypothetical protein
LLRIADLNDTRSAARYSTTVGAVHPAHHRLRLVPELARTRICRGTCIRSGQQPADRRHRPEREVRDHPAGRVDHHVQQHRRQETAGPHVRPRE